MRLSILICTIPEREHLFALLFGHLREQINELGAQRQVEIIMDASPRLSISVGAKRQRLLETATGDYVTFIDDDDWVPYSYVKKILKALESEPDCVGFKILCKGMNGPDGPDRIAVGSDKYRKWCDNCHGFDHVRAIYHKNPVKRSIALKVGYRDLRFGEDHEYSRRLKASRLLKHEVFIDEIMYEYRYQYEPHNKKYGIA